MKPKHFLILLILLTGVLRTSAFTVDGLNYTLVDGLAIVTGATSKNITKLVVPATVTYGSNTYDVWAIKSRAFNNYTSLREVVIEDSKLDIKSEYYRDKNGTLKDSDPFAGCPIEKVYIGRTNSTGGTQNFSGDFLRISSTADKVDITVAGKAEYVSANGEGIFPSNTHSLTIGGAVAKIYKVAIDNCTNLKILTFATDNASVSFPDQNCFAACSLDSVIINRNISSLPPINVENLIINPTVTSLSSRNFSKLTGLKKVVLSDGEGSLEADGINPPFPDCDVDSLYWGRRISNKGYPDTNGHGITEKAKFRHVVFGPVMKEIPNSAFLRHTELETVVFHENTERIGGYAFSGCAGLRDAPLPPNLKTVGERAFEDCSGLTEVVLPEGLETIGSSAFANTGIGSIVIPSSVLSLGTSAFYSCGELKKLVLADGEDALVVKAGIMPFYGCDVDSLYWGRRISDEVNSNSPHITDNAKFKHVTFGPAMKEIPNSAFSNHKELETVVFHENTERIKASAFSGCTGLTGVVSNAIQPPVVDSENCFDKSAYQNAQLSVPAGCKKIYRVANVWKLFDNIVSLGDGFTATVGYDSALGKVTLNGEEVTQIKLGEEEPLTIEIVPAVGVRIKEVTVNDVDVTDRLADGMLTFGNVEENLDVKVIFEVIRFNVQVAPVAEGGKVLVNGEDIAAVEVDYGSPVKFTLDADRGFELASLTVNGTDVTAEVKDGSYSIGMLTENIVAEASFIRIKFPVRVECNSEYGKVTVEGTDSENRIEFGAPLTVVVAFANEGCHLTSLTINGVDVKDKVSGNRYRIASVEEGIDITAEFAIERFDVRLICDPEMGHITSGALLENETTVTAEYGAAVDFGFVANEGYELTRVLLDGKDVTGELSPSGTLTLSGICAPHTLEAVFTVRKLRLTILGLEKGMISVIYNYGDQATVEIAPYDEWTFHSLNVNGEIYDELDNGQFTIDPITTDTELNVVFVKNIETGVSETAPRKVRVNVRDHHILVDCAEGEMVRVYDVSGKVIYNGGDHRIYVADDGIYVINVAGQSYKVTVY